MTVRGEYMAGKPWFSMIYSDKCDGCKGAYRCVHFCPHGVPEVRDEKAFVVNPLGCIYGCSACANLYPTDALVFPTRETSSRLIKKESLLYRVICQDCGKKFLTDRETEYCFNCEKQYALNT